ncbi:uncharacterized protein N7529_005739 [Penicillium soppii]|uniref:uncharacterized protein n=1 Tax=Penicillium soppii TaxID=69789 RepID=UPI002549770F|nr:uncharacterized protein N7529_005739 [Penicillium soppii]KAJ5863823.1 hypothetical protein N7529_005739 [Penicillium soppii]
MSFGTSGMLRHDKGPGKEVAMTDVADLWRDQESNLALIELAQEPRLAGNDNGWADPAVKG